MNDGGPLQYSMIRELSQPRNDLTVPQRYSEHSGNDRFRSSDDMLLESHDHVAYGRYVLSMVIPYSSKGSGIESQLIVSYWGNLRSFQDLGSPTMRSFNLKY